MPASSPSRAYRKRWRGSWLRLVSVSSLSSRAIFRTDFLNDSMRTAKATIADYADTADRTIKTIAERNGKQTGDPRKAARAIIKAVELLHRPCG